MMAHGSSVCAEVCDQCTRCAKACPVKALPFGPPDAKPVNALVHQGVKKWTSDAEKCFGYWAKLASDCAICLRVCPFNRDYSPADQSALAEAGTVAVARGGAAPG